MPCSRSILKVIALLVLTLILAAAAPRPTAAADDALIKQAVVEIAQADLLKCMEKCIRDEGSDSKATCKTRCAQIPSAFGNGGPRKPDCMANYKKCLKLCPKKDKTCKKACREQRMSCPG